MHGVCFLQNAVLLVDQLISTINSPYKKISQANLNHSHIKEIIMDMLFVIMEIFLVKEKFAQ